MIEKPKQFDMLYHCDIESFKKLVHKPFDVNAYKFHHSGTYVAPDVSSQEIVEFVNIKMTKEEYERFNQNWEQYLTLMYVARTNPMIYNEYHKLLMLVNLLA